MNHEPKNGLRNSRLRWALCLAAFALGMVWVEGTQAQTQDLIFGRKETFGIGPRAMGMGGAFVAVADDASAVYWNPAGLVQIPTYTLALSSAPVYFQRHAQDNLAFGPPYYASMQFIFPIAKENTLGFSLFRPFHPQRDFFAGDAVLSSDLRKEGSYLLNPTFQQDEMVFTYSARFSAARNFSMGVNVERITNDRYFIRYFGQQTTPMGPLEAALSNPIRVSGFGVGLGFLYRIPITKYSQELRIGLSLKDLVSRVQFLDGLQLTSPSGVSYDLGPGYESQIPPEITLGLAYKNNILFKVRNITALDFDQISDPRFGSDENKIIRFGTEFWFMHDILGIRGGYSTPMSRPGTMSLGLSVRALSGNLQTDLALLQPVSGSSDLQSGSAIGTYSDQGINFEKFHIGLTYRFGGEPEPPPPTVSAKVAPAAFAPSRGEKAEFLLDTSEDVTVDRWSLLIYDKNNKLVRGLKGRGTPPTRVVWAGEQDSYEPLPSGVYTWAFQVRDNLGHVGSTEVQTVEILSVGSPEVAKDPRKLYNLRQQQAALLAQESQRLASTARDALKKLLAPPEGGSNTVNATAPTGPATSLDATGNTTVPEAGTVPLLGLRNLAADQLLNAHFDTNDRNERVVAVTYRSNLTYVPFIYQEAAEVMKTTVRTVGTGVPEIETKVFYGKNELSLRTPSGAAANYSNGRITREQLIGLSEVRINGETVKPNAL